MSDTTVTLLTPTLNSDTESAASAISWPSIFGGALAIAALTVMFVTFGGALGIARPETGQGMAEMGVMAAIWLVITQWIASGIGGYLTGRLRTKWTGAHSHEVFFRDTAHGFLAWALALLVGAILLGSALVGGMEHLHGARGPNAAQMQDGPTAYYVDSLYRSGNEASAPTPAPASAPAPMADTTATTPDNGAATDAASPPSATVAVAPPAPPARINPDLRAETTRILMRAMGPSGLPDDDKAYLSQLVATHTGLSADEAARRVDTVTAHMQADAQKAHKAVGYISLFTALSMLIGAFIASAAAAFGGSQRDEWEEAVRAGTYRE